MANSSWFSTSNEYIKYRIELTVNSQDQANNYSNVTVKVFVHRTNTGFQTYSSGTCYCQIDGTTYTQAITNKQIIDENGVYVFSKTLNIQHGATGTKALSISSKIEHGRFTSDYHSYSENMPPIARASGVDATGTNLGAPITIQIIKADLSFQHRLAWSCGSESGVITELTSLSTVTWTPPVTLASQNTSGTNVTLTISCLAYGDGIALGTTYCTVTVGIPSSIVPTCTVSITDISGCHDEYGIYVKGKSQLRITVTGTESYGSPISAYSITANGKTYAASSAVTDLLVEEGSVSISASVTDGRGRSGNTSQTIYVYDYSVPIIRSLTTTRCNADGTDNFEGNYIRVDFECEINSLDDHNTAEYRIEYRRVGTSGYSTQELPEFDDDYHPIGAPVIAMSSQYSFDVVLYATDEFTETHRAITASTGFALINYGADGKSIGFGKLAGNANEADFGLGVRFTGGIIGIPLSSDADLNSITTPSIYVGEASYSTQHCPLESGMFALEVRMIGTNGQLLQTITGAGSATIRPVYRRYYQQNAWGSWFDDSSYQALPMSRGGIGISSPAEGAMFKAGSEESDAMVAMLGVGALFAEESGDPQFGVLPVSGGGTGGNTPETAREGIGAAASKHNHSVSDITDVSVASGYIKLGSMAICWGNVGASSMSGSRTVSISFTHFSSTPTIVACPYCTSSGAAGHALSAYVLSVSASSASVRLLSTYTGSLSVGARWIAIGPAN